MEAKEVEELHEAKVSREGDRQRAARRKRADDRIVAPWLGWLAVAVAVILAIVVIVLKRA
ncbi:MAG TPA: hypothetical protein VIQ62_11840 [Burkholderiales bacterium]